MVIRKSAEFVVPQLILREGMNFVCKSYGDSLDALDTHVQWGVTETN